MSTPCKAPIPFETLIAYHARELPEDDAERTEDHYFSCAYCTEQLAIVTQLAQGLRDVIQQGQLMASTTMSMVERARAESIVVREYRTDPGEHVDCTAGPTDDLLVTRYGGLEGI